LTASGSGRSSSVRCQPSPSAACAAAPPANPAARQRRAAIGTLRDGRTRQPGPARRCLSVRVIRRSAAPALPPPGWVRRFETALRRSAGTTPAPRWRRAGRSRGGSADQPRTARQSGVTDSGFRRAWRTYPRCGSRPASTGSVDPRGESVDRGAGRARAVP
jgi:hypothetical protein